MAEEAIKLGGKKKSIFIDKVKELLPEGGNLNLCLTCGACSSGCPATGLEGMDPRKFLRMAALGMDEEIMNNQVGLDVHHVPALHLRLPHEDRHPPAGLQRAQQLAPGDSDPKGSWAPATWPCETTPAAPWAPPRKTSSSWWKTCWRSTRKSQPEFAEHAGAHRQAGRRLLPQPELPRAGHRTRRNGAPVEDPAPGRCGLDLRHQGLGRGKLLHVHGRQRDLGAHRARSRPRRWRTWAARSGSTPSEGTNSSQSGPD